MNGSNNKMIETLEEAAESYYKLFNSLEIVRFKAFIAGAKLSLIHI
jgi:hypothetical protein